MASSRYFTAASKDSVYNPVLPLFGCVCSAASMSFLRYCVENSQVSGLFIENILCFTDNFV
jgi:hypothetical protein